MTLQKIIKSLDDLSIEDKTSLLKIIRHKLSAEKSNIKPDGETFWEKTSN